MSVLRKLSVAAAALACEHAAGAAPEPPGAFSFAQMRLIVCDFDATRRFYQELLRLPVEFKGDRYMEFRTADGATIGVFAKPLMPGVKNDCPRSDAARNTDTVLVLRVAGVDKMAKYLEAQRVPQVLPPQDRPGWGVRTAHFLDPAGNLVELLENLPPVTPAAK